MGPTCTTRPSPHGTLRSLIIPSARKLHTDNISTSRDVSNLSVTESFYVTSFTRASYYSNARVKTLFIVEQFFCILTETWNFINYFHTHVYPRLDNQLRYTKQLRTTYLPRLRNSKRIFIPIATYYVVYWIIPYFLVCPQHDNARITKIIAKQMQYSFFVQSQSHKFNLD